MSVLRLRRVHASFVLRCFLLYCVGFLSMVEGVLSHRRVVSSCTELRSALEAPEVTDIEIVRSFPCDTTSWNQTTAIQRDVNIRGREHRGVLPHIDWGTSSKKVVAGSGSTVAFENLIFIQQDMGIGNIDIVFFKTAENASAFFSFVVIGVLSCPWHLNVSHFQDLDRPASYPGKQWSEQLDDHTVEAYDVVLHWEERRAVWHLSHTVFTCNTYRKDPALMGYYQIAQQNGDHHHHMHPGEMPENAHDDGPGNMVIYILVVVCGTLSLCVAVWGAIAWVSRRQDSWTLEVVDEEKGPYFGEDNIEQADVFNKTSSTPENWAILDSDVALEAPLGHGEFGRVYRGCWQGTTVAVKVIKHNDQCLRTNVGGPLEAFFARHISHPNVVQTYQISKKMAASVESPTRFFGASTEKKKKTNDSHHSGSCSSEDMFGSFDDDEEGPRQDGTFETWLILEYCDRGSLADAVASGIFRMPDRQDRFRMSFVAKTALEIASAMNYLHSVRIIHGDLKTGNVLLKGDGSDPRGFICKVGDFGLSRFLAEDSHIETFTCGTVTHMPPELLKGGVLTSAADVYSFAILLWEVLAGRKAHHGKNQGEIILAVVNNGARPVFPANIPPDFVALIESCWCQEHLDRPIFPVIIDRLSLMLQKYEKEEGLQGGTRTSSHPLGDSQTRSSFFSHQDSAPAAEKKKSLRLVPKKFSSLRVNPAQATATVQAPVFLDSYRSLHLSLDGNEPSHTDEAITSLQTTRSLDGATSQRDPPTMPAKFAAFKQ